MRSKCSSGKIHRHHSNTADLPLHTGALQCIQSTGFLITVQTILAASLDPYRCFNAPSKGAVLLGRTLEAPTQGTQG